MDEQFLESRENRSEHLYAQHGDEDLVLLLKIQERP